MIATTFGLKWKPLGMWNYEEGPACTQPETSTFSQYLQLYWCRPINNKSSGSSQSSTHLNFFKKPKWNSFPLPMTLRMAEGGRPVGGSRGDGCAGSVKSDVAVGPGLPGEPVRNLRERAREKLVEYEIHLLWLRWTLITMQKELSVLIPKNLLSVGEEGRKCKGERDLYTWGATT